jgi:hypothetical protein
VVQAPPGEEVCLSGETVAVYAERPVRCYGLMSLAAALVRARLEPGALAAAAAELAAAEPALKLACLSAAWEDGAAALSACLPPEPAQRLAGVLAAHGGEVEGRGRPPWYTCRARTSATATASPPRPWTAWPRPGRRPWP